MDVYPVTCPTCFEYFDVPLPPASETPSEVDYDCEVCCRPMVIRFDEEFGEVVAGARGIHD
ncbi:MAG: CPXCG motif-containing cysteine-rich protein [Verrucomicrobiota bacterium]